MNIRAISLWQPWASLMAVGAKHIETRSWSTAYRGLVAIHAAKKWDSETKHYANLERFRKAIDPNLLFVKDMPRGCFVALGRLHRCLSTNDYRDAIPARDSSEFEFGNYDDDRFMWVFDEIWELRETVCARGYQGLWTLDEAEAEVILAMLPEGVEERLEA